MTKAAISDLMGKTITKITEKEDELQFHVGDDVYYMFHDQSCCEDVRIEEIIGDLQDLVGSPILEAEGAEGEVQDDIGKYGYMGDKQWTFYKLGTIKGHVNIRWYGTSNGYYSTGVSFQKNTKGWCYE